MNKLHVSTQEITDNTGNGILSHNASVTQLVKAMEVELQDPRFGDQEKGVEVEEGVPQERAEWGGKIEFILTCVGYAVGLGNVWRFPYLCYKNGGGAFLVPYVIMLALVGLPFFFMELAFGQFASLGPITIWTVNPLFKGLGWAMVISNLLVGLYYNVIIAWCVYYFIASMTSRLPWQDCTNPWNTPACLDSKGLLNNTFSNMTVAASNLSVGEPKTPSEEFFYNKMLNMSSGMEDMGDIQWGLAACLGVAWLIVFLVLIKGISSLGKVVYFSSIFPYLLLTCMLVRGVTLPGAMDGIRFYIQPDFKRLTDATCNQVLILMRYIYVWSDAAVQIFFSLSTCSGGLVAMASFNKFNNNCLRDSFLVPLINCGTSVFAGFVIFSVLGFMAHEKGVEVKDVAASGPGLVFVVYPEALTQMPVAPLWATLFFFMMMTLGFSSEFSIIEGFFASICDEFSTQLSGRRNTVMRGVCCALFFCVGLSMCTRGGFYLCNLVDTYVGGFPLLFIGFFECVALMYVYGYSRFAEDIEMMLGRKPFLYFKITWCFIAPAILFAIIIFKSVQYEPLTLFSDYTYPAWALAMAWSLVLVPILAIPVWFLAKLMHGGGWQFVKDACEPTAVWGPRQASDRRGRYDLSGLTSGTPGPVRTLYEDIRLENAPQARCEQRGNSDEYSYSEMDGCVNRAYSSDGMRL